MGDPVHPVKINFKRYRMDFSNKLVLITGGSSGIGFATACELASLGADIWILARNPEKLTRVETQIKNVRRSTVQQTGILVVDVTDESQVREVLNQWMMEVGTPDLVINCSGEVEPGYFDELSLDTFHQMMDVNFFGTLHVNKTIIPGMIARKSGHIVNIASGAGLVGWYGYTAYGSSKYAVRGLSEHLRTEMKPYGIKISVVFPFDTKTPQLEYEELHEPPETKALSRMLGSPVKVEFVARAIVRGIYHNRFYIIPGLDIQVLAFLASAFPGIILPLLDLLVKIALKKSNSTRSKKANN
jgi:3-dehydrosphinganine reductase